MINQEELTLKFIVIRIQYSQILLSYTSGTLILVHTHDTLQELYHFILGLMPHGSACIDTCYIVGGFDRWLVGRRGAIRMHRDRLVILITFLLFNLR